MTLASIIEFGWWCQKQTIKKVYKLISDCLKILLKNSLHFFGETTK